MTVFKATTKELLCGECGDVIASVAGRVWPPKLEVTSVEGYPLTPVRAGVLVRQACEEGVPRARVDLLDRNAYELAYELRCRSGHKAVRLVPELARAIRATKGRWVTLAE